MIAGDVDHQEVVRGAFAIARAELHVGLDELQAAWRRRHGDKLTVAALAYLGERELAREITRAYWWSRSR